LNRNVIREFFLRGNPNPNRDGCPGPAILIAIAEDKLTPSDPARLHLASCSPCFAEFRELRESYDKQKTSRRQQQRLVAALALAVGLLIAAALRFNGNTSHPFLSTQRIILAERTVNPWDKGALRGQEQNDTNILLPQSPIQLHVTLPRLSKPGRYTIGIAHDKFGRNVVEAPGVAKATGSEENVTVILDLRSIKPGVYFLTTTRDDEQASYYFPVVVS
jgi:hypothetical protein